MTNGAESSLIWRQIFWPPTLDADRVVGVLRQWAADGRSPRLILEARSDHHGVQYRLATPAAALPSATAPLKHTLGARLLPLPAERQPVELAGRLKASTHHRPLRAADSESVVRAVLGGLTRVQRGEQLVL